MAHYLDGVINEILDILVVGIWIGEGKQEAPADVSLERNFPTRRWYEPGIQFGLIFIFKGTSFIERLLVIISCLENASWRVRVFRYLGHGSFIVHCNVFM